MTSDPGYFEQILRILASVDSAVSIHDLGSRCRANGLRINTPQLSSALRTLQQLGRVRFEYGRWISTERNVTILKTDTISNGKSLVIPPTLSDEAYRILQSVSGKSVTGLKQNNTCTFSTKTTIQELDGPWTVFRRLLKYYRRCLQAEEGADASAYQNQIYQRFLYLENRNMSLPKVKTPWRYSIPILPHLAPFLSELPSPNSENSLVFGYPISAIYKAKEGEPPISIVRPIFYFPVEYTISSRILQLDISNPIPEINLSWLDFAFKGNISRKRAFLSSCGMFNNSMLEMHDSNAFIGGLSDYSTLICILESFVPFSIQEHLDVRYIQAKNISEPFKNGIYNRAVLMIAKRTKYSATLCKELKYIEDTPDSILDQTALAYLFKRSDHIDNNEQTILHEAIVPEIISLNAEQRLAAASLLKNNVTVITGPPGTGKSQVVAATIGGIRLKKQTLLFASRNHKAIDAVVSRVRDSKGRPLITRANSKDDPNLKYNFRQAIRDLLAATYDPEASVKAERLIREIEDLLKKRGYYAEYAKECVNLIEEIGSLEGLASDLRYQLSRDLNCTIDIDIVFEQFPVSSCRRLLSLARVFSKYGNKLYFLRWVYYILSFFDLGRIRTFLRKTPFLILEGGGLKSFESVSQHRSTLEKIIKLVELRKKVFPLEAKLRKTPDIEGLTNAIRDVTELLLRITPEAISYDEDSRQGLVPGSNRQEIDGLRHALQALETGLVSGEVEDTTIELLKKHLPTVLTSFPCWAVTNLSVGSRIPFFPGIFDLVVIDEASQSDIPSAIPLLFRSKRVGIVGDPWQLPNITKLSEEKNTLLLKDACISVKDMRFSYTGSSLYDLVAAANGASPILLAETYRSVTDIAEYSNELFYGGRLRVGTNEKALCTPSGVTPGVHWTDIRGIICSAGSSGCYCQEEINTIVNLLRVLLLENSFKGSIGVVTPFRQQAIRLHDALFMADTIFYQALVAANCHVDTAHGFQGDERDVMLFSLCGGPNMPSGSLCFLRETGRVFNVAVSRAKAVLHVVGNREWAMNCGISHIKVLAIPKEQKELKNVVKGEWYPHDSPWEKVLFDALKNRGLEVRPQFKAGSRRLDIALVDDKRKVFLDIEVDGDCHRDSDGFRKTDDIWRDIQLQGMGWRVLRFWTYQLRENLKECVDSIEQIWRNNESRTR